jgi:hypothetical protein
LIDDEEDAGYEEEHKKEQPGMVGELVPSCGSLVGV